MHCACVLALIALLVELVNSFSWDIVVGRNQRLEFYNNGTLIYTKDIPLAHKITSVTYDPVQHRVLFTDDNSPYALISSFDLSTRQIQLLISGSENGYSVRVVYDPVTQFVIWGHYSKIYSLSLINAISNKAVDGNLLVTLNYRCRDVAVDSCGGYIYWITDYKIERARLDGSEREVLIDSKVYGRRSLAIDQQTKKMYWTELVKYTDAYMSIKSADFNGKNSTTLYNVRQASLAISLAVSKDFIYWQNYNQSGIWQLPKSSQNEPRKLYSMSSSDCLGCHRIATNYTIGEQIQDIQSCHALKGLIPTDNPKPESTVSVCQNYCFQGECGVSAEGQPTCSCKAGYSGDRCEVKACHQYCLNGGVCSLNETSAPVCQCTSDYYGERCDVPAFVINCIQTISLLKNMLNADITPFTLGREIKSTCASAID